MTARPKLPPPDPARVRAQRVAAATTPAAFRHENITDASVRRAALLAGVPVEVMRAALAPALEPRPLPVPPAELESLFADEDTTGGQE